MADKDYSGLLIAGGVGVGLYFLYQYLQSNCAASSSGLCSMYNSIFGTPAVSTATPASVSTVANVPVGVATPASPAQITAPSGQSTATMALTLDDINTLQYSASISSAQMAALNDQIDAELQAGQVQLIAGGSVLAYMLGWGNTSAPGTTKAIYGLRYTFDGTNWNLSGVSGSSATAGGGGAACVPVPCPANYSAAPGASCCTPNVSSPSGPGAIPTSCPPGFSPSPFGCWPNGTPGVGNLNNNVGWDLYTGFAFSDGSAGGESKSSASLGAIADERFAGSRVPNFMIHRGPGYQMRRT